MPHRYTFNSNMYPETIMFNIFRDHNVFDITRSATLHADEELRILEEGTKKRKSDKSRAQIKREEAQRIKSESTKKRAAVSEAFKMKADAAVKHADAIMRQQELESIKTANELGLYSKSALKAWMDKHLAKTFAAGKDAEVIDLTSDDGTNTDTTNSPDSTTVSTNNNSTPNDNTRVRLFTDDDNEEEENQKPSAGVTNNNGTNTHSTYANEQQQTYYSSFTGSYDVNTFGDAKYNTKKSQPTLTQGGMGYVIPFRREMMRALSRMVRVHHSQVRSPS